VAGNSRGFLKGFQDDKRGDARERGGAAGKKDPEKRAAAGGKRLGVTATRVLAVVFGSQKAGAKDEESEQKKGCHDPDEQSGHDEKRERVLGD